MFDYNVDFKTIDFRKQPELYRIGMGEQGVLLVEPYKCEILPHWRFKTVAEGEEVVSQVSPCYCQNDIFGRDRCVESVGLDSQATNLIGPPALREPNRYISPSLHFVILPSLGFEPFGPWIASAQTIPQTGEQS